MLPAPNKRTAAAEFSRVRKPEGRLGFSDLTRTDNPLPELDGFLSWIACIGDAQTVESYIETLQRAGLHDWGNELQNKIGYNCGWRPDLHIVYVDKLEPRCLEAFNHEL